MAFEFVGQHIWATFVDQMGTFGFVTRFVFAKIVAFVKHNVVTLTFCLRLRQGFAKGAGQEGNSGVTTLALGSVRECEGMNPHTPK